MVEMKGACARCKVPRKICVTEQDGQHPVFCSTELYGAALRKAEAEYEKPEIREFARRASIQEATCYIDRAAAPPYRYPVKPRLQEIIEFARGMGYRRLGVAFCGGLHSEAEVLCSILETHGFEVLSVMCKVGGVDKAKIGLAGEDRVKIGKFETMCNPVAQAEVLNEAETDFNILLGLCVGHDSLFMKYSRAMVTVFAVKDRVLAHTPLGAIYTCGGYYERFKEDRIKEVDVK